MGISNDDRAAPPAEPRGRLPAGGPHALEGGRPQSKSDPRPRQRRWARPARFGLGIALGLVALWAVGGQRGELVGVTGELSHLRWPWLVLASAAELGSTAAFARMQGRLFAAGGGKMRPARLFGVTMAAGAIASSLPAGPAVSSVYVYRQYKRHGSTGSLAAWTLLATLICSALGLAILASAGVLAAEQQGSELGLVGVTIAVLAIALAATAMLWQRRLVSAFAVVALRLVARFTHWPRGDPAALVTSLRAQLAQARLTWHDFVPALTWSLANWVLDCGCLVCGFLAVGSGVPWRGLLLAYGAGQLAANLPVTPGGLGVVEGSLTVALVAFGGAELTTVAAVIVYRIVSFWGYLPAGWLSWAVVARLDRLADRRLATKGEAGTLTGSRPAADPVGHSGALPGPAGEMVTR